MRKPCGRQRRRKFRGRPSTIIPVNIRISASENQSPSQNMGVQTSLLSRPPISNGSPLDRFLRSEEHTSELQSLMRNSYAVFCLKKKKNNNKNNKNIHI